MSEPAFLPALSYEDYLHLPDDGRRYELVEGDLFVTAAPVPKHQRVVIRLIYALEGWAEATGGGEVLTAPLDVLLAPNTVVQPDVVVVLAAHADRVSERGIEGAPDLVIEVLSERTRRHDEVVKRHLYDKYGVAEYWVIDRVVEAARVYRRPNGGTLERAEELTLEAEESLTSPLLAGFSVDLKKIFG